MSLLTIVILAIVAIVVLIIALIGGSVALINLDLMSYTATGTETMTSAETAVGNALVVYNPGVSGAAKISAKEIAGDLRSRGYKVELAGVRSTMAANTSGYDIVVVGGPVYFGTESSATAAYMKALTLKQDARLGVFGTTGTSDFVASDLTTVEKQVASLQSGKRVVIRLISDRDEKKAAGECKDFVAAVLQ